MREVNKLVIRGPASEIDGLLQRLEGDLSDGWERDREVEARLHRGLGGVALCFRCTAVNGRQSALLWLSPRAVEEWEISQVIPMEQNSLSDQEYNHILVEFNSQVLEPLCRGGAVRTEILPDRLPLEAYLSRDTARLLREYSAMANRTENQPSDKSRWQDFVIQVHLEDAVLEDSFLEGWLASEGWPEEPRAALVREYTSVRDFLWHYDEERRAVLSSRGVTARAP